MDISASTLAGIGNLLQVSRLQQQHELAVLKMANDQIKQNGEIALQLLQSVPAANGSLGQNIDVMV